MGSGGHSPPTPDAFTWKPSKGSQSLPRWAPAGTARLRPTRSPGPSKGSQSFPSPGPSRKVRGYLCSSLLREGENCWRIAHTKRAAFLIDVDAYFSAFRQAVSQARDTVFILGWDIDSCVQLN